MTIQTNNLEHLASASYQTFFIDPDCRHNPKTDRFCAVCQRYIKSEALVAWLADGCHHVVHPMDIHGNEIVGLIGPECATRLAESFVVPGQFVPIIQAWRRWNLQADEFNSWSALGDDEKVELVKAEPCRAGDIRVFTKSGNVVQLIRRVNCDWQVVRTQGASEGKHLQCPETGLTWCLPGDEAEALQKFEQWLRTISQGVHNP